MCNLNIVIIDDDELYAQALSLMLAKSASKILCYTSAEEGLAHMLQSPPDILVMDINMPKIDGRVMCEIVRSHASLRDLPIVLISGNSDIGDFTLYFKGVDFLQKPVDTDLLTKKVELYHTIKTAKDKVDHILQSLQ